MSRDLRELLRNAAEADQPEFNGARLAMQRGERLRWHRRAQIALPVIITAALIAALGGGLPDRGELRRIRPAERGGRPTQTPSSQPPTAQPDRSGSQSEGSRPQGMRTERRPNGGVPGRQSASSGGAETGASCQPLIEDPRGDTRNWGRSSADTVDILSSTITFEAETNSLTFKHVLKDIPAEHPTGDALVYELHFTWDNLRYTAEVWIDNAGREGYGVHRARRGARGVGDTEYVNLSSRTGQIDRNGNTVTLPLRLDEFNQAEREASAAEGHQPPAELRVGSQLHNIDLWAYMGGPTTGAEDRAVARCPYVIGR